jgi:integrase
MSKSYSTSQSASGKPGKPYPEFPLFAHAAGVWAKKIRGKLHYFGPWDDPDKALANYLAQKDDLHAGRKPKQQSEALTVKDVCNVFLTAKKAMMDGGELSRRTFLGYEDACKEVIAAFGKNRLADDLGSEDFAVLRRRLAASRGPKWLGNTIQNIRCLFKYAFDARLLSAPIHFGPEFKRPAKKVLRMVRAQKGANPFTAKDIRSLLEIASVPMRAMILLGINCGFGNADCGALPRAAVDLEKGNIDFPRPKTGIPRRCILWPETIGALRDAIGQRPTAKNAERAGLVFLTRCGVPWHKDIPDSPITKELRKMLKQLGLLDRKGRSFYTLRHTFRTVADETKDQPAIFYIMGHEIPDMSSIYREAISDDRLRSITDHVRAWLFNDSTDDGLSNTLPLDSSRILSEVERQLRNLQYGLGKANYQQVLVASRLMKKGWVEPYYYRGHVWLTAPSRPRPRQSKEMHERSVRAIRITKTGQILLGV